jgi:hypothetical protein
MTCSKGPFNAVSALCAVILTWSAGPLNVRDADFASQIVVAAQTAKQQCMSVCRARYRDCRHLSQLPSFECKGIYQDCTQYKCTGLGPG